jgi:hypothetical protein
MTLSYTLLENILPANPQHMSSPLKQEKGVSMYESSVNNPIPEIDTTGKEVPKPTILKCKEYFNETNVDDLLREQIFLQKLILIFLAFLLISNLLDKK